MACTAHRFPAPMILNRYRPPSSSRSQAVSMTCPSIITQPSCSSLAVWSEALNLSRAMSCSQSPMSSLFLAVMGIEMLFVYPVLPYSGEVTEATDTDTDTGQAASISAKRPSMNSSIMLKVLGKPGSPVPDCKRYRSGYTITERMRQRKDIRRDEALLLHTPHPRRSRNEGESFHPQTRQISRREFRTVGEPYGGSRITVVVQEGDRKSVV